MISYRSHSITNKTDTELHTYQIHDDLYAFKLVVRKTVLDESGSLPLSVVPINETRESVHQGFMDAENIRLMAAGGTGVTDRRFSIITEEGRRDRVSPQAAFAAFSEPEYVQRTSPADVFDALNDGRAQVSDIFFHDQIFDAYFDLLGNVLPEVIQFSDNDDDFMNDRHYDLEAVVNHLFPRPDIHFLPFNDGSRDRVMYRPARSVDEALMRDGEYRHVFFFWSPSFEDAQRIWAGMRDDRRVYNASTAMKVVHQKIFEMDLLGLRESGAVRLKRYQVKDAVETFYAGKFLQ